MSPRTVIVGMRSRRRMMGSSSRAGNHLHGADILAHGRDRHTGQQELQLLRHGAGGQTHRLQAILLQGKVRVGVRVSG